jgi:N utilization substance protein B
MTEQAQPKPRKPSKKARLIAARLASVQCLYQMALSGMGEREAYQDYVERRMGKELEGDNYVPADLELLSKILTGVSEKRKILNEMITGALETKKPEPLLQSILFCGLYELMDHTHVDSPVIINDYVNITHGFFDQKEADLINAVLDRQAKNLRP